jgi:O-antigen/teichoic acid export membrane protein
MSETDSKRAFYRQGSWMVVATFVSGLLMFAVHIFGGWMSREEYGLFVTLLQILNLMMIPALGLQTVFAQRTAAAIEPGQRHDLAKSTRKILLLCLYVWLAIVGAVLLNQAAVLDSLKIDQPTAMHVTLLLGLPQLALPVLLGILQGRQNFAWLGGAAIANGAGRFAAVGVIVALLGGQAAGATTGVLIGLTTACLLAGWHGRQTWLGQAVADRGRFEAKAWLGRIVPLTLGLGAGQFMLSADMIAARAILPPADSGPYGAAGMIGRGLVAFTAPLAAVMFPKLVREAAGAKSSVLGQAFLGTALLGVLAGIGCTLAAWLLPGLIDAFPALAAKKKVVTEITPLIPYFIWGMLPLALGNVFVAALMAKEQYRAVPWLVGIALLYGLTLAWLANAVEPPSAQAIILTLGGFNLVFLGTAAALARRYAATPTGR